MSLKPAICVNRSKQNGILRFFVHSADQEKEKIHIC